MKAADIFNKIINWKKKEQNTGKMIGRYQEEPVENIEKLEAKSATDESHDGIHKALDALIRIKDGPRPISLQMEKIDAIKSNVMSKNQTAKKPCERLGGKNEVIGKIKGRIKVGDIKTMQKMQKGYIKHYSGYFSNLRSAQVEIKPRAISKITAYKGNILRHFKEVYKSEHE